ncbi:efflux RND transporter periplasmic adaptor subunit [Desulfovibrio inopinatus]|uniref:efflux RND transporter periplasmic adaptor subunit n=1 Tax=Desulfovibrio inopinatus TaxID=102109 RepID=UPI0004186D92|nr:efflux RND transporter periplasmic adaptor subunit [Desulfovibrio inopinatus]
MLVSSHFQQFFRFILLLCLGCALTACASEGASQDKEVGKKQAPPPEVVTETIATRDIPLELSFMGQTAGSREVEIRARVGGILLHRYYVEGKAVKKGDIMFEIDPASYEAALTRAKGTLHQAEAQLGQADRDHRRYAQLYKEGVIARKDLDDAITTLDTSRANLEQARGALREAELNLEWTRVEAPISGMTSQETRSEGSLIVAGTDSSLLTTMAKVDPVYVHFSMSGPEVMRLRRQRAEGKVAIAGEGDYVVRLIFPDGSEYQEPGRINFTDTQVDEKTGVVKVRAVFPNPDSEVLPGQFARVKLEGAYYVDAISIPQTSVLNTQQGNMVWALDNNNVVQPRMITLGETVGNTYLVEKGLNIGDRIITEGVITVRPGVTVQPKLAESESKSPPAAAAPQAKSAPTSATSETKPAPASTEARS